MGTEWSLSLQADVHAPPLLSPHLCLIHRPQQILHQRSHPSISHEAFPFREHRDRGLSPQCSANHLEPGPSPALGFQIRRHPVPPGSHSSFGFMPFCMLLTQAAPATGLAALLLLSSSSRAQELQQSHSVARSWRGINSGSPNSHS